MMATEKKRCKWWVTDIIAWGLRTCVKYFDCLFWALSEPKFGIQTEPGKPMAEVSKGKKIKRQTKNVKNHMKCDVVTNVDVMWWRVFMWCRPQKKTSNITPKCYPYNEKWHCKCCPCNEEWHCNITKFVPAALVTLHHQILSCHENRTSISSNVAPATKKWRSNILKLDPQWKSHFFSAVAERALGVVGQPVS